MYSPKYPVIKSQHVHPDIVINKFLLDNKDFTGLEEEDAALVKQRDMHRLKVMEGYLCHR